MGLWSNKINALKRQQRAQSPSMCTRRGHMDTQQDGGQEKPREEASEWNLSAGTLIVEISNLQNCEKINFCYLSHTIYGILLWKPNLRQDNLPVMFSQECCDNYWWPAWYHITGEILPGPSKRPAPPQLGWVATEPKTLECAQIPKEVILPREPCVRKLVCLLGSRILSVNQMPQWSSTHDCIVICSPLWNLKLGLVSLGLRKI